MSKQLLYKMLVQSSVESKGMRIGRGRTEAGSASPPDDQARFMAWRSTWTVDAKPPDRAMKSVRFREVSGRKPPNLPVFSGSPLAIRGENGLIFAITPSLEAVANQSAAPCCFN